VDNGAEFTAHAFTEWCEEQKIELFYIEPGRPDQNAFVERFNRTYREEVLDAYLFHSLEQVREITELWIPEYNEERPHEGLGCVAPLTFEPRQTPRESTSELCTSRRSLQTHLQSCLKRARTGANFAACQ
jgi:putative transposase